MSSWVSENLSQGIHIYSGGEGSTVVLVPGWPETAEAYNELFPLLAQDHSILSVDPPGLGDSAPSEIGYDTGAIGRTLEESLRSRAKESFHLVGHDVGAWIAYAWAAQFPNRVAVLLTGTSSKQTASAGSVSPVSGTVTSSLCQRMQPTRRRTISLQRRPANSQVMTSALVISIG